MKLHEVDRDKNDIETKDDHADSFLSSLLKDHDVLCPAIQHYKRTLESNMRSVVERIGPNQSIEVSEDLALLEKICPGS